MSSQGRVVNGSSLGFTIDDSLELTPTNCSISCSFTFAAVCIVTLPEGARGRLESIVTRPADGVSCEGCGAVILRRNYPLPESSAALAFLRGACGGV